MRNYIVEKYIKNYKDVIDSFTHYKVGDKYYPNSLFAQWFMSYYRPTKEMIAEKIKENKKLRWSFISNWYEKYKETHGDLSFKDFINKEITVYRGITDYDLKKGRSHGFDSYTPIYDLAYKFANSDKIVVELKVKPKNTYGMITSIGYEQEVMIPTGFSDEFKIKKIESIILDAFILHKLNNEEINDMEKAINEKNVNKVLVLVSRLSKKYK